MNSRDKLSEMPLTTYVFIICLQLIRLTVINF